MLPAAWLLLHLDRRPRSILIPIVTGAAVVIPLFVKQNTGLAFLSATSFSIIALIVWQGMRREPIRHYLITLFSALTTLAIAIVLIHRAAGLSNYWQWTIRFAAERRTPATSSPCGGYGGCGGGGGAPIQAGQANVTVDVAVVYELTD